MHTASVFLLGIITLFAARFIAPERLLPWLALASGLIVIVIGARMLLSRLRPSVTGAHQHHRHDQAHPHDHEHDHAHAHSHLPPALTEARFGWRGVLAIGVSGGLVPCPAGLVVLLSAIGLGRIGFGCC